MNCDNLGQNGFLIEYNVNCLKHCDKEFFLSNAQKRHDALCMKGGKVLI